jgi:hypothetical protein
MHKCKDRVARAAGAKPTFSGGNKMEEMGGKREEEGGFNALVHVAERNVLQETLMKQSLCRALHDVDLQTTGPKKIQKKMRFIIFLFFYHISFQRTKMATSVTVSSTAARDDGSELLTNRAFCTASCTTGSVPLLSTAMEPSKSPENLLGPASTAGSLLLEDLRKRLVMDSLRPLEPSGSGETG